MILGEYDIVATGIKSLLQRLPNCPPELTEQFGGRLVAIEQAYRFDRDSMWRIEVGDATVLVLLAELDRRSRGQDPLVDLSRGLERVKRILSPLAYALESWPERTQEFKGDFTPVDHTADKQANLERLAFEVALGKTRLDSVPLRHVLDVTSRCNYRCLTCHQSQTQDVVHYDLAEVPLAAVFSTFAKAKQIFVAGMGEPLLSRSAFEIVRRAKASGSYVELITNGTTLGRGSRILSAVDMLMVSMDGGTEEAFNAIRRNGSLSKLRSSMLELDAASRKKICFNVVVCRQNVYTMPECIELGIELGVGHIHFQEMAGYLPWHDRMLLETSDRAWFFQQLPNWTSNAGDVGISVICNLVREAPTTSSAGPNDRIEHTRIQIQAVAGAPIAAVPRREEPAALMAAIDELLGEETAAVFRSVAAAHRRLRDVSPPPLIGHAPGSQPIEWIKVRDFVEDDKALFPHCMSTYAHLVVNGDGTTRSCCKVQSRLARVDEPSFDAVWNSPAYVALRSEHAQQRAPRAACHDCRDPIRFHFLIETLEVLEAHDIDITLMRKPRDFPLPASMVDHPLVVKLGANALPLTDTGGMG